MYCRNRNRNLSAHFATKIGNIAIETRHRRHFEWEEQWVRRAQNADLNSSREYCFSSSFRCSYEDISMDSNQNQNSNPLDFSQSGIAYKDIVPPGLPNQVRVQHSPPIFSIEKFTRKTFRMKIITDSAHNTHRVHKRQPIILHQVRTASIPICPITIPSLSTFPIVQLNSRKFHCAPHHRNQTPHRTIIRVSCSRTDQLRLS